LDTLDSNDSLNIIRDKTSLRPSQLAFAIIVFLAIVLVIAQASTLVVCIGCFLIPAYFSIYSLDSHDFSKNIKYLTYWVIFIILEIFSTPLEWMLGSAIYSLGRVALTAALLHPQIELSQKLYHDFISPYIMGFEKSFDRQASDVFYQGKDKFDELASRGKDQMRKMQ